MGGSESELDGLLERAGPSAGLGARQSLASLQSKLFGQAAPKPRVGRFELGAPIGSGGGGAVYRGRDTDSGREVAIKLLHAGEEHAEAPSRARLLREAQALANLHHPNVVEVLDVGEYDPEQLRLEGLGPSVDRGVFVAMEYVEGSSLGQWLKATPHAWQEVRQVFVQAGRGLAAAHKHGIMHRDFKPANVLVGNDGRVLLVDFGLARAVAEAPDEPVLVSQQKLLSQARDLGQARLDQSLTKTGTQLGTPVYMAPEQHEGRRADERSDQYAFCVALYEGIFEHPPFVAITDAELLEAKLASEIIEGDVNVPKRLWALFRQGLAPNPAHRFQDMDALLSELEAAAPPRYWLLAVVLTVAVLAFAAVIAMT